MVMRVVRRGWRVGNDESEEVEEVVELVRVERRARVGAVERRSSIAGGWRGIGCVKRKR